jgi:acyl-CoA thioesterase
MESKAETFEGPRAKGARVTTTKDNDISPSWRTRLLQDPWGQSMGVQYLEIRPGYCRLSLQLQPHMVNVAGYPHGGVIFSLADIAFATASNSYGAFEAVALNVTISYLATVPPDARLFAEARERKRGRRAGFYEVTVTANDGILVALVQCVAHRISDSVPQGAPLASP